MAGSMTMRGKTVAIPKDMNYTDTAGNPTNDWTKTDRYAQAMQVNERARQQRAQAQAEAAKAQHMASLSPAQQLIEAFVAELRTKHEQFPSYKEKPNAAFHNQARALAKAAHEGTDWSADEKRQAAEAIETWLPKLVQVDIRDERKKLKLSALKGL